MQMDATRRPALMMTIMLALAAGACQSKTSNVGGTESAARDTTALPPAEIAVDSAKRTSAADSSGAPKAGLNDETILGMLDGANKGDSAGGALAAKKATDSEVKAYAEMTMKDHHELRVGGEELAKKLGVTAKPLGKDPIAGYANAEMVALQKAEKGEDFDRTYIDNEVAVHQAVLDAVNMARVTTTTPELKALIQNAIPVIQKHLEQAQAIQKRLGPAA
jgi:putative membrane protein